jgi:hypothetical protein
MPDYKINLEDKFGSLRLIDVGAEAAAVGDEWVNQTLTTVNDSVVRLGVVEGHSRSPLTDSTVDPLLTTAQWCRLACSRESPLIAALIAAVRPGS